MNEIKQSKLSDKDIDKMCSPLILDLLAVFQLMQEDIFKEINSAIKNGNSPDTLIGSIEKLF